MEKLSIEEREAAAIKALEARRTGAQLAKANVNSNYLENPQLKEFNKQLRAEGFRKARRPIKLNSVEDTNNDIQEYFDLCDEYSQLPSLKSLCLYLGISVATFNTYLRDPESEYSELFMAAVDFIHSVIENGAMNNKINPATYMFTAANFYGMRDSKSIEISASAPNQNNSMTSRDSLNALRQQVEKEKQSEGAVEASFVEKVVEHE